jgi:hypothetical protein
MAALFLITGVLLIDSHRQSPAGLRHLPPASVHIQRSDLVQANYLIHAKRLRGYYELLEAALKANAPDLLSLLESPEPMQHGYRILPKIIAGAPAPEQRPRAQSLWYSWPWTDHLIDEALKEIAGSATQLKRAAALSLTARRKVYEKLAVSYRQIRQQQKTIDAHIQYNRLWQTSIAANRLRYDRETILHDAVLERQAITDVLKAPFAGALKNTLAKVQGIDLSKAFAWTKGSLIERELLLARDIHQAIGSLDIPAFVRVEHCVPYLLIIHVPLYTDIEDHDFVRSVKEIIEEIWHFRDGEDEFRVELAISLVTASQLYTERQLPRTGDKIDFYQHVALFPEDRAVLTSGALATHVYGRAIILGPHDLTRRVLAHEFGHILGFRDIYFRGYKDLGKNGFQVMEVVADPKDIMGAPDTGGVLRNHFERIVKDGLKNHPDSPGFFDETMRPTKRRFDGSGS